MSRGVRVGCWAKSVMSIIFSFRRPTVHQVFVCMCVCIKVCVYQGQDSSVGFKIKLLRLGSRSPTSSPSNFKVYHSNCVRSTIVAQLEWIMYMQLLEVSHQTHLSHSRLRPTFPGFGHPISASATTPAPYDGFNSFNLYPFGSLAIPHNCLFGLELESERDLCQWKVAKFPG